MKYSKINTKNKKLSLMKVFLVLLVVLIIFGGAIIFFKFKKKTNDQNQQPASTQQQTEDIKFSNPGSDTNQSQSDGADSGGDPKTSDNSSSGDQPVSNQNSGVNIVIDSLTQSGGRVSLSSTISGISSGNCSIKFVAGDGSSIDKSAAIENNTCSLSLSELEFSYIGDWSATVSIGDKSNTKGITIK